MDYALAGFVGCFLFWALGVVRFPVAFSGFANDTAWFLFGALLLGVIATRSGIARRLVYFIMLTPTSKHGTPPSLLRCELTAVGYRESSFDRLIGSDAYLAIFAPPSVASRTRPEAIVACKVR